MKMKSRDKNRKRKRKASNSLRSRKIKLFKCKVLFRVSDIYKVLKNKFLVKIISVWVDFFSL